MTNRRSKALLTTEVLLAVALGTALVLGAINQTLPLQRINFQALHDAWAELGVMLIYVRLLRRG